MTDCLFCKIVAGIIPSHKIYEDEKYLGFLTIFPNTEGFSIVIPKEHFSSYAFEVPDAVLTGLVLAAKKVAQKIDKAYDDVGRTGLMFEGFGVDHLHAKLFPMHGTGDMTKWRQVDSNVDKVFETYEGYMSSHNGPREDDTKLSEIAKKIASADPLHS